MNGAVLATNRIGQNLQRLAARLLHLPSLPDLPHLEMLRVSPVQLLNATLGALLSPRSASPNPGLGDESVDNQSMPAPDDLWASPAEPLSSEARRSRLPPDPSMGAPQASPAEPLSSEARRSRLPPDPSMGAPQASPPTFENGSVRSEPLAESRRRPVSLGRAKRILPGRAVRDRYKPIPGGADAPSQPTPPVGRLAPGHSDHPDVRKNESPAARLDVERSSHSQSPRHPIAHADPAASTPARPTMAPKSLPAVRRDAPESASHPTPPKADPLSHADPSADVPNDGTTELHWVSGRGNLARLLSAHLPSPRSPADGSPEPLDVPSVHARQPAGLTAAMPRLTGTAPGAVSPIPGPAAAPHVQSPRMTAPRPPPPTEPMANTTDSSTDIAGIDVRNDGTTELHLVSGRGNLTRLLSAHLPSVRSAVNGFPEPHDVSSARARQAPGLTAPMPRLVGTAPGAVSPIPGPAAAPHVQSPRMAAPRPPASAETVANTGDGANASDSSPNVTPSLTADMLFNEMADRLELAFLRSYGRLEGDQ